LFVADIRASCDFYVEKLGFGVIFAYGEPPYYAQVKRDSARLNFRHVEHPAINPGFRDRQELLSATLMVATPGEISQLFLEFQKADVVFAQTLTEKPWGARDFIIRDIDGNLLLFAGPAE
jgi:catechol 2,3-dioxygenase-like lactoylglutathione lyase family enzyme